MKGLLFRKSMIVRLPRGPSFPSTTLIDKDRGHRGKSSVPGDFRGAQGCIDIWQGEAGETSKPVGSCMNEFSREFVAAARQGPSFGAISSVHPRCTQPYDGNVNTGIIRE